LTTVEDAIHAAVERVNLNRGQAYEAMGSMMRGEASASQIAAFSVAFRMKGETDEEMVGFASAMRDHAVPISHNRTNVVDTCGTGGDKIKSFNLSTAAAVVASAAGVPIAKHGNRAVTGKCGSADVLEALGAKIDLSPEKSAHLLEEIGLAFLFAPKHHPAMRYVGPTRAELKLRTVFNLLGPLTNPASATRQLIGVYSADVMPKMANAMLQLGITKGVVAHGVIGMDEISPIGETQMLIVEDRTVRKMTVVPEDFGICAPKLADIECSKGTEESVERFHRALGDVDSPEAMAVIPGASVAIWLGGLAPDFLSGADAAKKSIGSGAASKKLKEFIERGRDA
jgi:anthranilate phosphoribosyltransferase